MKCVVRIFLIGVLFTAGAAAEGVGFLNVVNLVAKEEPVDCSLNGKELMKNGLETGTSTGWFIVPMGEAAIKLTVPNLGDEAVEFETAIPIVENISTIVVIYLSRKSRGFSDKKLSEPEIRVATYPTFRSRGYQLKFVSTFQNPATFRIGLKQLVAQPLKPSLIESWRGQNLAIRRLGKEIGRSGRGSEGGSYYLFIGRWKTEVTTVLVRANPQKAPKW